MIEWHMEGIQYGSCNCDHACPCQFEGLPNYGNCQGFDVFRVDRGAFAGVDLEGVVVAAIFAWPGPIFEGGGELQLIIDDRATEEQVFGPDAVLGGLPMRFGLGFMLRHDFMPLAPTDRAFGHAGAGGSIGMADPENKVGFGFTLNKMQMGLMGAAGAFQMLNAFYDEI